MLLRCVAGVVCLSRHGTEQPPGPSEAVFRTGEGAQARWSRELGGKEKLVRTVAMQRGL